MSTCRLSTPEGAVLCLRPTTFMIGNLELERGRARQQSAVQLPSISASIDHADHYAACYGCGTNRLVLNLT
jgi:hypothetical protein